MVVFNVRLRGYEVQLPVDIYEQYCTKYNASGFNMSPLSFKSTLLMFKPLLKSSLIQFVDQLYFQGK